jgi:hypothetical protein
MWKKPWLWFAGSVAALALLLGNINSILSNARTLPGEVRKTSDQFFEWYGDYDAWKGEWSNNPEGFADLETLGLSSEPFRISIDETKGGSIGGTIRTKGICDKTPIFEELLIDGTISSSHRATIVVFDFIGGFRRNFAKLNLSRDGYMMTAVPIDDPSGLFAKSTRIAHFPDEYKLGDDAGSDQEPICAGKRAKFFTDLATEIQKQRKTGKKVE